MTGAIFVRDLGGHPCALHTGRVEMVGGGEKSKEKGGVVWREHCPPWRTLQLFAGISKLSFHSRSSWKRCCFPRDNADCHPPLFRGPFVLSPSLLANQANILRPLFARLLGKMRHNRTPRHCLFCLVWKDSPPCKASAPFKYLWIFHKGAIAGSKGSNELFNNPRVKN